MRLRSLNANTSHDKTPAVELRNFGVLEVQKRLARIGLNPNKLETNTSIPDRAVIKFKSGKILRQKLKKLDLAKI